MIQVAKRRGSVMDHSKYEKLLNFIQFHKQKLEESKVQLLRRLSFDNFKNSVQNVGTSWKKIAYVDAFIFTILGFVIVGFVASTIPEVINDPVRLAIFWLFMFTHLFLGFLTFVALYQNSSGCLKFISTVIILLQLGILGAASDHKGKCANALKNLEDNDEERADCLNLEYLSSKVILPNFIHSLIFCAILIIYIYKRSQKKPEILNPTLSTRQQKFKFANITVIVEEVV